jgi:hypothetical protein
MKITMLFVFASLFVNSAAFAVGPNASAKCKDIADKIQKAAKAAPASGTAPAAGTAGSSTTVQ